MNYAVIIALLILLAITGLIVYRKRIEGLQWEDQGNDILLNTGLNYLDVYDEQDLYRNSPYIYPVPYTYETAQDTFM